MDKLPFSVYDFFACLSSGFVLIASVDYAFNNSRLINHPAAFLLDIVLVLSAYTTGHVVAEFASRIYERGFVRHKLGDPIDNLFGKPPDAAKRWRWISKSYYDELPEEICDRIRARAQARQFNGEGRALYYHCHSIVKRDPVVLTRLNTFLNLYGFARNVSLAALVSAAVLLGGALRGDPDDGRLLGLSAAALIASIGLFYRYIKFFRLYTFEVFVSYAEAGP